MIDMIILSVAVLIVVCIAFYLGFRTGVDHATYINGGEYE
jgi:hypothetical protein